MVQIPEHIILLIEKGLQDRLSKAEAQTLQQWRSENTSHEIIYRQLEKIWLESGAVLQERAYNQEQAWNKVDARLNQGKKNNIVRLFNRLAVAACMAGLLFIAGWLLYHKPPPSPQLAKAGQTNMPVTLPDGSQVVLRKGATLAYPEEFRGHLREVTLTGEAWFEVQPDTIHPFRIQTTRATLEVLGTSFTVNTNHQQDELTVATGKVAFTNKAKAERHIIYPQQSCILTNNGFAIKPLHDPNFLSWKTGIIEFDNTPIDQVAAGLANHYRLYIRPDSLLMQLQVTPTITAKFDQQPIDSVLEEIKLLTNISYRKQNDTILLFKK